MDEDGFWALLAECRQQSGNDTELMSRFLFRRLRVLDPAGVVAFVEHWERARSRLYSWPVADAACLLLGSVDEDDLRFVQDWIISHGRSVVDRVARNSDDLVDLAADAGSAKAPWFQEFTTESHLVVSGTWPVGHDPDGPEEFTGVRCDLDDHGVVERRFPRMAALRRDRPEIGRPELR